MLAVIMESGQSTINDCMFRGEGLNGIFGECNEEIAIDMSNYIVSYLKNRNKEDLLGYISRSMEGPKILESLSRSSIFRGEEYVTPTYNGVGEWRFKYESYQAAMQGGLDEFNKLIYCRRESIIESILAQYKHKCMRSYLYYDEVKGNLYFDMNEKIKKTLTTLKLYINNLTNGKIILEDNFNEFFVKPNFEEKECSGINKLRKLEEGDFKKRILSGLEDISWYDIFIDVYQDKDTGLYCYGNLNKVCRYFGDHIIMEIDKALNDANHGVNVLLSETFDKFNEDIRNELELKFRIIDNYLK